MSRFLDCPTLKVEDADGGCLIGSLAVDQDIDSDFRRGQSHAVADRRKDGVAQRRVEEGGLQADWGS